MAAITPLTPPRPTTPPPQANAVMIGDTWSDIVAAHRAGCEGVLVATGYGEELGAVLAANGVSLPTTLVGCADDHIAPTDFLKLAKDESTASGAAAAVVEYIEGKGEAETALVWEALQKEGGVRMYADLSGAVDGLLALPVAPGPYCRL